MGAQRQSGEIKVQGTGGATGMLCESKCWGL